MAETETDTPLTILPEQAQEDALHANRLLSVEERPFQRVTKQLLGNNSALRASLSYLPSPPPDNDDEVPVYDVTRVDRFREDVLLDFAYLESSIIRIQLTLSSNQRERERYAAEKAKILETAQAVRDNTVELRTNLVEAQEALERRKGYDVMAAKILDDKKLKSRDEAKAEIEKLEKEIEDLQHENAEYEGTWQERREQFNKIVHEGEAMLRQIKGIKEDPEEQKDDEGMEDDKEDDDNSGRNTPAQGGRSPQPPEVGNSTPLPESGEGQDSMEGSPARLTNKFLEVDDSTRAGSHASSPLSQPAQLLDDMEMDDTPLSGPVTVRTQSFDASQGSSPAKETAEETMDES